MRRDELGKEHQGAVTIPPSFFCSLVKDGSFAWAGGCKTAALSWYRLLLKVTGEKKAFLPQYEKEILQMAFNFVPAWDKITLWKELLTQKPGKELGVKTSEKFPLNDCRIFLVKTLIMKQGRMIFLYIYIYILMLLHKNITCFERTRASIHANYNLTQNLGSVNGREWREHPPYLFWHPEN